jgi:hypothetical protein
MRERATYVYNSGNTHIFRVIYSVLFVVCGYRIKSNRNSFFEKESALTRTKLVEYKLGNSTPYKFPESSALNRGRFSFGKCKINVKLKFIYIDS